MALRETTWSEISGATNKPDAGVRRGSGEPPHNLLPLISCWVAGRDLQPSRGVAIAATTALRGITWSEISGATNKPDAGVRRGSGEPPHNLLPLMSRWDVGRDL